MSRRPAAPRLRFGGPMSSQPRALGRRCPNPKWSTLVASLLGHLVSCHAAQADSGSHVGAKEVSGMSNGWHTTALLVALVPAVALGTDAAAPSSRRFEIRYVVDVPAPPGGARRLRIWLPY